MVRLIMSTRNNKIKKMLDFTKDALEQMMEDPNFKSWTAEKIFSVATETAIVEFSAKGVNPPIASVDNKNFAFNSSEDIENIELIMIHGEDFFNDED